MNNLTISVYTNQHKKIRKVLILLCCLLLTACTGKPPANSAGRIMVLSISSDGKYVISSSVSQHIVLWNIPQKAYQIIAGGANIYSAYFIKNTDDFIYQDDRSNKVYVMNVHGKTLKILNPGFPTYGEVLTANLNNYFAANVHNEVFNLRNSVLKKILYHWCGPNYQDEGAVPPKGMPYTCYDFEGIGKLFGFTLANNEKFFTNAGNDEYYLWDATHASLIKHVIKNEGSTIATISPNDRIIISTDDGTNAYLYNIKNHIGIPFFYDFPNTGVMKAFEVANNETVLGVNAVKYIDNDHVLVFIGCDVTIFNYATLFKVQLVPISKKEHYYWIKHRLKAIKYLPLMRYLDGLEPITYSPLRGAAIDTAPSAHVLVIAQAHNNGILVYQYDPKTQTLKPIWEPVIK